MVKKMHDLLDIIVNPETKFLSEMSRQIECYRKREKDVRTIFENRNFTWK